MNYEYLNKMIKYIKDNLTENIEYKKLAKIVGTSEYTLQRMQIIHPIAFKEKEIRNKEKCFWGDMSY